MPSCLRSLVFASLIGIVALPATADVPGAADRSPGSGPLQQAKTAEVTGRKDSSATDRETSYSWDRNGVQQVTTVWLPDERAGPMPTLGQIVPAVLMIVLVALGLTITFTSLRKDMKQRRRVVYRPRTGDGDGKP